MRQWKNIIKVVIYFQCQNTVQEKQSVARNTVHVEWKFI